MRTKWYQDPLFYIACLIVAVICIAYSKGAHAESSVTLTWTAPTEQIINCQSEPVQGLAGFRIYELVADINDPAATTYVINERPPGTQTYVSTAYNTDGNESINSNSATKEIGPLRVTGTTAYVIGTIPNKIVFFVVGTVPLGTLCFESQTVNGRYAFDVIEMVPTNPASKPLVVYASCG